MLLTLFSERKNVIGHITFVGYVSWLTCIPAARESL
jgi:hypothetical protein